MVRREKINALILSRRNSGEADRVLTLLTRNYGLLRAVAKGVRKIPSRRGGHVEPFSYVVALVSGKPGHLFVSATETQNYYPALRESAAALQHAHEVTRLVMRLLTEDQAHPDIFDAVAQAWDLLPQLPAVSQRQLHVAVSLLVLHRAGILPDLSACQVCGIIQPRDAIVLDSREGGWHCLPCHTSLQGTQASLSPRLLKALRFMARCPQRGLQVRLTGEESYQLIATVQGYCAAVSQEARIPAFPALYSHFDYGHS